jgi:hypothetical protein
MINSDINRIYTHQIFWSGYSLINKVLGVLLAATLIFNGVFNHLMGEIYSEGLALLVTLLFLLFRVNLKINIRRSVWPVIIVVCGVLFYNFITVAVDGLLYRILFFYQYIFFSLILLLPGKREVENNLIVKILIIFSCVSSIYALAQRLGFDTLLPLENDIRATGLSRSSLNLSGVLLLMFALSFTILFNDFKKWLVMIIIFIGILSAGGRGSIVGAILLACIGLFAVRINIKNIIYIALFTGLPLILFNDWLFRSFSAFDFVNDQSNIDRLGSYGEFLNEFNFFGGGIGTTSPALSRFGPATGFESFALNTLYELGIPFAILLSMGFLIYFYDLEKPVKKNIFFLGIALAPIFFGQQMLGTPSVFSCMALVYYFVVCKIHKVSF